MALVFATGKQLTLSIGGTSYSNICTSATLEETITRTTLEPITGGSQDIYIATEATLSVDLIQDWNSTSSGTTNNSVCRALYDAATSAPNTSLAFSLTVGGTTWAGNVYPEKPSVGGASTDALTSTVSFKVVGGSVTRS